MTGRQGFLILCGAASIAAAAGCVSEPKDPSQVQPVAPSEISDRTTAQGELPTQPAEQPPPARPDPPPIVEPKPVPQRPAPAPEPLADHSAARIELSALSRSNRRGAARQSLDLRLDAFAADGTAARMAGEVRVTVEADGAEPAFAAYDIPMSTRAEEARHYDAVLGQYVLRVAPAWSKPPRDGTPLRITVTVRPRAGGSIDAGGTVRW
jgi:hypothetical protein